MKRILQKIFGLAILLALAAGTAYGQGITTSGLSGVVRDNNGDALPGATIQALHTPSGTNYGVTTNNEGRFQIPNMRVGGPYNLKVTFVGFKEYILENINLSLGQTLNLNINLSEESEILQEVIVRSTRDQIFDGSRTGASTGVTSDQIDALPTISRSIQDFARLSPLASTRGNGISFAGANNRYNQFSIDGTVNNDVFGLAANGTNGGQTGTQPISLDAIEEINIEIAPMDVRMGGFTGGGINAVTRSGTNSFEGSAYYFVNNEALTGKGVLEDTEGESVPDYSERQYGFRVGGPIIKNKLFFFVNGEQTERTQPKLFGINQGSNITQGEIDQVVSVIDRIAPNADIGNSGQFNEVDETRKFFARLDWNINANHRFSIRHNYVNSESLSIFRNPNTFVLSGGAQFFPSTTNTTVAELSSRFSNAISNELRVGYTTVRDDRGFVGTPFPYVRVDLGGPRSIQLGSEQFGTANTLSQDVFTITDNLTFFQGKHAITVGTHNEFYSVFNLFIRQNFGSYRYSSLDDWLTVGTNNEAFPLTYDYSFSQVPNDPQWGAAFNAAQIGFYAQDEYQATDNFKLTIGLRADVPLFFDTPTTNPTFNNDSTFQNLGLATDQVATSNILWSPRVGFNWDVTGDKKLQLRGGAGIFSGRLPFVWLSNQFSNTGIEIARLQAQRNSNQFPDGFTFNPDPNSQPNANDLGLAVNTSEINVVDPDFKYPQVLRVNAGLDYRFDNGIVATFDGIYSKNINNILYQNLNIEGVVDDTSERFEGPDNRPRFGRSYINTNFTDVIYLTNTNAGYSYNLSTQLSKRFESGLFASLGYNYGVSKDINPGTSSQALSNWRGVETNGNPNNPELSFSNFMVPHRLIATITYRKEYLGFLATSVGLFYNGQSGLGQSFTYNGDLNNDRILGNDLLYIPANRSDIVLYDTYSFDRDAGVWNLDRTADQQYVALNEFIENDDYLSSRRGQYAERNGGRTPFEHRFDIRIAQEFFQANAGKIEFTFDVLNFGNLLNKEWGRSFSSNNTQPINVAQFGRQAGGEPKTINGTTTPIDPARPASKVFLSGDDTTFVPNDFFSRWRAQVGIRYTF